MHTLNRKISVTKVWKSKIWNDEFLGFSVAVVMVYSIFSVGAVFTTKFFDQNYQFWKISKKQKKHDFVWQNSPLRYFFCYFFFHPSFWHVQKVRLGPPNFDQGLGFHGDMTETKSAILRIFIKNIIFFTDQYMIEAIA